MNADTAWTATLGELELQMTRATFNTWLKDARLLTNEDSEYVIGVRNDYAGGEGKRNQQRSGETYFSSPHSRPLYKGCASSRP